DLSSVVKAGSGGAPVSPSVVERFEQATGIYVHNLYGLTETTSPSHLTPLGVRPPVDPRSGALSVGIPVPGCVARIADLTTREVLPIGEIGEIVIEGAMVVPGYWEKPEESARAIPDGRLHTGDVGFMDADGWFYIVDRAKDQINASGYKIWPRDVEDVLYRHPAVREAAVIGKPDPYRGETVKAFVSLVAGQRVEPEELIAFCKGEMAAYKYPREVEILPDLPKTPTGKFLRRELRDRERAAQPGTP
ncbi:MAG: AMP-binding protein, partial [Nitriliruptorales bacterium]|nr:AMP-binding protein [Nitriliruptorales bacterium]